MDALRPDAAERIIGPEDIRVLVFTCNRRDIPGIQGGSKMGQGEHYIYQTLSSLWMCDPMTHRLAGVDLMIGSGDPNYLWWFYRHTDKVKFHEAPPDLNKGADTAHRKLTRNYMRTIQFALETDQKGFLICEDDVVFADGFWDYAMNAINEMRCIKLKQDGNTLTFYSPSHYIGKNSFYRGAYFCSGGGPFAGLCGIYYDRECLQSLLDYLVANECKEPADLLYVTWSDKEWTRYATPIGLVQHVGGVSAGTSRGQYWTDARFGREMLCWDPGWKERPYERFFMRTD
jgi:hypothetical protein